MNNIERHSFIEIASKVHGVTAGEIKAFILDKNECSDDCYHLYEDSAYELTLAYDVWNFAKNYEKEKLIRHLKSLVQEVDAIDGRFLYKLLDDYSVDHMCSPKCECRNA